MNTHPCVLLNIAPERRKIECIWEEPKPLTLERILADVCNALGEDLARVKSKQRKRELVLCRKIFCYVAKIKTGAYSMSIAKEIGNKEHTTTLHHIKRIRGYLKVKDPSFMDKWLMYLEKSQLFTRNDFK